MLSRGRAAEEGRRAMCQLGPGLEPGDHCGRAAVASIGAVRVCQRCHDKIVAIAVAAGVAKAEAEAAFGRSGGGSSAMRISRECDQCHSEYMAATRGNPSRLCPDCRAERDKPKERPVAKPKRAPRPTHAQCQDCPERFAVSRLGPIPIRCPACRLERDHHDKKERQREWHRERKRAAQREAA